MLKVIIPSAKIVPVELQNLGKLPAVIYPVNQRIVFDYLYEQYKGSEFTVVCFENAAKIHRRLSQYHDTKVINLDELGDLGYSIYHGIKDYSGEGIINFADTIVMDDIHIYDKDFFFYAEDEISSTWTFFEESNGVIKSVLDKKEQKGQRIGKLFVGVFKISHLEYLRECLEKAFDIAHRSMNTYYYALMLYSQMYSITPIKTDNWFDVGHVDKYYNSQLEVKARTFNHIKIDKERGILTKTSDDIDKFIGEIKWYLKLPNDIEYVRPRIFDYSLTYTLPYVSMEYYAYHTIHELYLYGDLSRNQWKDIFRRIKFVCSDFKRYSIRDDKIKESLEEMYLRKTIQRLESLKQTAYFELFFTHNININSKEFFSLNRIMDLLRKLIPQMLYDVEELTIIHGDLCFSNIMVDNNFSFVKVIDPRGKFGQFDIYGDQRYEIAKLMHSIDGKYDFIIKELFDVEFNSGNCTIDYYINNRERPYDLYKIFIDVFKDEIGNDLKKIELIEALLFLSMIPLHTESVNQQMVMLAIGIEILNRVEPITI